jgi:hypothetical protein
MRTAIGKLSGTATRIKRPVLRKLEAKMTPEQSGGVLERFDGDVAFLRVQDPVNLGAASVHEFRQRFLVMFFFFISSLSCHAITVLIAAVVTSSWIPSSLRKSSSVEPQCGFLGLVMRSSPSSDCEPVPYLQVASSRSS